MKIIPEHGYIYGLSCSCDEEHVRYVGLTTRSIATRLDEHLDSARKNHKCHRCHWIRAHTGPGHQVLTRVLETSRVDELAKAELKWIRRGYEFGWELTNASMDPWSPHGPETFAKLSSSLRRVYSDPARRAAIGQRSRGRKLSAEARKKMSESRLGVPKTDEWRTKASAAQIGKTNRGHHTRYHVHRARVEPTCEFCKQQETGPEGPVSAG